MGIDARWFGHAGLHGSSQDAESRLNALVRARKSEVRPRFFYA
jgi:hypothetical protein